MFIIVIVWIISPKNSYKLKVSINRLDKRLSHFKTGSTDIFILGTSLVWGDYCLSRPVYIFRIDRIISWYIFYYFDLNNITNSYSYLLNIREIAGCWFKQINISIYKDSTLPSIYINLLTIIKEPGIETFLFISITSVFVKKHTVDLISLKNIPKIKTDELFLVSTSIKDIKEFRIDELFLLKMAKKGTSGL